jgi:hypothetical protein
VTWRTERLGDRHPRPVLVVVDPASGVGAETCPFCSSRPAVRTRPPLLPPSTNDGGGEGRGRGGVHGSIRQAGEPSGVSPRWRRPRPSLRMTTAMIDFGLSGEHSRRRAGGPGPRPRSGLGRPDPRERGEAARGGEIPPSGTQAIVGGPILVPDHAGATPHRTRGFGARAHLGAVGSFGRFGPALRVTAPIR